MIGCIVLLPLRICERLAIDLRHICFALHEELVLKLVSDRTVAFVKLALSADGLSHALAKDLPVFFAFVSVIIEHPLCWCELWHDSQLQLVQA